MRARDYLERISKLNKEVNSTLKELEEYERMQEIFEIATRVTSSWSDMPRHRDPQSREKLLVKLIDMKYDVNDLIDRYVDRKMEAIMLINRLSKAEYVELLICRYIDDMEWREVSKTTHYSENYVLKLHRKALAEFDQILADTDIDELTLEVRQTCE